MKKLNGWFLKHVWGSAAPIALIVTVSLGFTGIAQLGVWGYLSQEETAFIDKSVVTELTIVSAGEISSTNSQKLVLRADADSPVGERTYDKTVDLNGVKYDRETSQYIPYKEGEQLSARVIADNPDSLRLDNKNEYQSSFFIFSSILFLALALLSLAYFVRATLRRRRSA